MQREREERRNASAHPNSWCIPFITDFSGTVDVLDGEDTAQAVECDFGQSWNQLRCRHQHVDAVGSVEINQKIKMNISVRGQQQQQQKNESEEAIVVNCQLRPVTTVQEKKQAITTERNAVVTVSLRFHLYGIVVISHYDWLLHFFPFFFAHVLA